MGEVIYVNKCKQGIINVQNMFTILRWATVIAGALGTLLAVWLALNGRFALWMVSMTEDAQERVRWLLCGLWGYAVLTAVCVCCYASLVIFFRMCGRLHAGSAFTDENARAMERIARMFAVCGVLLLASCVLYRCVLGDALLIWWMGLFLCAFLGVGLLAKALALLTRRAAELQRENDLTV